MQVGDNAFQQRDPALVNVAGDADDPSGPTYMTMGRICDGAAREEGEAVIERLDRSSKVSIDEGSQTSV